MKNIIFATNNAHKMEEVKAILGDDYHLITLNEVGITEEIPEDEPTIEGNALQKARYVYERTHADCFADDTGLEVEALDGAPGVHSARYATDHHDMAANRALLLKNLSGATNRKARFRTVAAMILDGEEYTFEGVVNGIIIDKERGEGGFGYDSLFVPEGYGLTFAELPAKVKNSISHRGRAFTKLSAFLNEKSK